MIHFINKLLASFGYVLEKQDRQVFPFRNFENLVQAYEQRLGEAGHSVPPMQTRAQLLARLLGTPPSKAYYLIEALAGTARLDGDVCEFGVAQGETSALIANEILPYANKRFHLFDSFAGLPQPSSKDQLKDDIFALGDINAYAGRMSCPDQLVRTRLEEVAFPVERTVIHKGFIEMVLLNDPDLPRSVSFAYLDFDFYEPTLRALEFLHGVTPVGAIMIVDDYNFFSTGAKTAVDEFIAVHRGANVCYECQIPDIRYGHLAILTKVVHS